MGGVRRETEGHLGVIMRRSMVLMEMSGDDRFQARNRHDAGRDI